MKSSKQFSKINENDLKRSKVLEKNMLTESAKRYIPPAYNYNFIERKYNGPDEELNLGKCHGIHSSIAYPAMIVGFNRIMTILETRIETIFL